MNKKTTYLLGILMTVILGAILQWYFCCDCNASNCKTSEKSTENSFVDNTAKAVVRTIPFSFSDGPISIRSQDNLNFFKSKHTIIEPVSEYLQSCLKELTIYFKNNPNKILQITGWYSDKENNLSNHKSLGHARAWAIKTHLKNLGFPGNQIKIDGKKRESLKSNSKNIIFGPYRFETSTKENDDAKLLALKKAAQKQTVLVRFFLDVLTSI